MHCPQWIREAQRNQSAEEFDIANSAFTLDLARRIKGHQCKCERSHDQDQIPGSDPPRGIKCKRIVSQSLP